MYSRSMLNLLHGLQKKVKQKQMFSRLQDRCVATSGEVHFSKTPHLIIDLPWICRILMVLLCLTDFVILDYGCRTVISFITLIHVVITRPT